MFRICATVSIISENKLFLGVAGCRDTLILYYFLIHIFTDLDTILISQWSERNGEDYIQVRVVVWFWCWLCSCWDPSGIASAFDHATQDSCHQCCLCLFVLGYPIGLFGHNWLSLAALKIFDVGPAYCVCAKYLPVCRFSSVPGCVCKWTWIEVS